MKFFNPLHIQLVYLTRISPKLIVKIIIIYVHLVGLEIKSKILGQGVVELEEQV